MKDFCFKAFTVYCIVSCYTVGVAQDLQQKSAATISVTASASYGNNFATYVDKLEIKKSAQQKVIRSGYGSYSVYGRLHQYFNQDVVFGFSLLQVAGNSLQTNEENITIVERSTAFIHASLVKVFSILELSYGFTTMLTLKQRPARMNIFGQSSAATIHFEPDYSMAYPAFVVNLFHDQKLGLKFNFLGEASQLVYGWLDANFWYKLNPAYEVSAGTKFFNQENFGRGASNFLNTSYSAYLQAKHNFGSSHIRATLGMLIHATKIPLDTFIPASDRLYLSLAYGFNI